MGWSGLIVAAALFLGGGVVLWVSWEGSQGRLRRGHLLGVRLHSTLASDAAWHAAHRAAAGPLGVSAGVVLAAGLAVLAVGVDDVVGQVVTIVGVAGLLVGVVTGCRAAARAARAVEAGDA